MQVKGLRDCIQYVLRSLLDELIARHAPPRSSGPRLKLYQVLPQILGSIAVVLNIRIAMQSEYLWCLHQREGFNGLHERAPMNRWGRNVSSITRYSKFKSVQYDLVESDSSGMLACPHWSCLLPVQTTDPHNYTGHTPRDEKYQCGITLVRNILRAQMAYMELPCKNMASVEKEQGCMAQPLGVPL